jgi:hypothetical protein
MDTVEFMSEILSKKEAIEFTGIDKKSFENYLMAGEFTCQKRQSGRGRFRFEKDVLSKWMKERVRRTVKLTREDYALCLDFALAQHFRSYVKSDFGTGRQREFGQMITNWIKGQLGEVAVQKFLKNKLKLLVELDFEIRDAIVPQDIIGVIENGKSRPPRIGVGIKSSKPKNVFLILGENEIDLRERRSDVYIFCRPNIPDDHLLRIAKKAFQEVVKGKPNFDSYRELMPDFTEIDCEVVGWCKYDELNKVKEIPNQKFDGYRFVLASGKLKHDIKNWEKLKKMI